MTQAHNFITRMRQIWDDTLEQVPPENEDANYQADYYKGVKREAVTLKDGDPYHFWDFPDGSTVAIAKNGSTVVSIHDFLKQEKRA